MPSPPVGTTRDTPPAALSRPFAAAGLASVSVGALLIGVLHVVGPSARLDPVRRTISEYALLETGWVFDLAVLVIAAGSIATLAALVGARLLAPVSVASAALLLWSVSLAAVVRFPKHDWSVGPSTDGDIHRIASVCAFVSLPVAAIGLGLAWRRHPDRRRQARWSLGLGLLALACFAPILGAVALEPVTGVRWWRAIPLGGVERLLVGVEVIAVLFLGWWATRVSRAR